MGTGANASETDLFAPIQAYFTGQGYTVQGEVRKSDVACVRGDELVIVEMKLTLNAAVLAQAVLRQEAADRVYVAILKSKNLWQWRARSKSYLLLLRRMELGLLLVSPRARKDRRVIVEQEPLLFDRVKSGRLRGQIMREVLARRGEFNTGGSVGTRIVSAYRETAVHIACCLTRFGAMTGAELKSLGTGRNTFSILERAAERDGWFARDTRGRYTLTDAGVSLMHNYPEVVTHFAAQLDGQRLPASLPAGKE